MSTENAFTLQTIFEKYFRIPAFDRNVIPVIGGAGYTDLSLVKSLLEPTHARVAGLNNNESKLHSLRISLDTAHQQRCETT